MSGTNDISHGMYNVKKAVGLFLALFIVSVAILSFTYSIQKPYTLDEVEEARMAEKINKMGPATFFHTEGGGNEDLSHPLLYSYTNAVFYRLFGPGEISFRGYGVVFFMLSLAVLILFVREAFKSEKHLVRPAAALAGLIYIINPLLIQHSMLLNADNNISAFAILLYVYFFYKFEDADEKYFIKNRIILACLVAFNFMCKEVTPIFLMASVIAYRLIRRELKKFIADLFLNIALGLLIFWGVWSMYCLTTGTDILAFIKFTAMKKSKSITAGFLIRQLGHFFTLMKWPFYWAGASLFILVTINILRRAGSYIRTKGLSVREDFPILASVFMFTPFIFIKPSIDMMKYQYPAFPVFIFCVVFFLIKDLRLDDIADKAGMKFYIAAAILMPLLGFWYFAVGDYILSIWNKMQPLFYLKYYVPLAAVIGLSVAALKKFGVFRAALLGTVFMIFPVNIGLNLNQTRDYTTSECWLNYGERGLSETVQYLKDRVKPGMLIYCRNDIGYYLNYRYNTNVDYRETAWLFRGADINKVAGAFREDIVYFVFDKISSFVKTNKLVFDILGNDFFVEKQFGDFVVLRSKRSVT